MEPRRILKLLERWDAPQNEYWIGVEPLAAQTYHMGPTIRIGPECRSLEDLEKVIEEIRVDLDAILSEAREKIEKHNRPAPSRPPQ